MDITKTTSKTSAGKVGVFKADKRHNHHNPTSELAAAAAAGAGNKFNRTTETKSLHARSSFMMLLTSISLPLLLLGCCCCCCYCQCSKVTDGWIDQKSFIQQKQLPQQHGSAPDQISINTDENNNTLTSTSIFPSELTSKGGSKFDIQTISTFTSHLPAMKTTTMTITNKENMINFNETTRNSHHLIKRHHSYNDAANMIDDDDDESKHQKEKEDNLISSNSSNGTSTTNNKTNITVQVSEMNAFEAASRGYFRHSLTTSVILTIAYTIVFIVGIIGNSFVVAIVCKSPKMRTVTNYFIVNLALADILVLLFSLPATLVSNLFMPYVLGLVVCKAVSYLQGVAVSASINTMVAVTIDRFLAIFFPLDWHMSRRMARWTLAGIWLFSMSLSLPWAIFFSLVPYTVNDNLIIQVCTEDWPSERWGRIYFVCANLILLYLFPATIIILCHLGIWYKIERRNIPGDRPKGLKIEITMQKSKLKVARMMMVVVVIFLLSWLPLYLIFARIKLVEEISPWEEWLIGRMMPLAQWLGASNSCINPILYTFFNRRYKRGFIDLLKLSFCCCFPRCGRGRPINGRTNQHQLHHHHHCTDTTHGNGGLLSTTTFLAPTNGGSCTGMGAMGAKPAEVASCTGCRHHQYNRTSLDKTDQCQLQLQLQLQLQKRNSIGGRLNGGRCCRQHQHQKQQQQQDARMEFILPAVSGRRPGETLRYPNSGGGGAGSGKGGSKRRCNNTSSPFKISTSTPTSTTTMTAITTPNLTNSSSSSGSSTTKTVTATVNSAGTYQCRIHGRRPSQSRDDLSCVAETLSPSVNSGNSTIEMRLNMFNKIKVGELLKCNGSNGSRRRHSELQQIAEACSHKELSSTAISPNSNDTKSKVSLFFLDGRVDGRGGNNKVKLPQSSKAFEGSLSPSERTTGESLDVELCEKEPVCSCLNMAIATKQRPDRQSQLNLVLGKDQQLAEPSYEQQQQQLSGDLASGFMLEERDVPGKFIDNNNSQMRQTSNKSNRYHHLTQTNETPIMVSRNESMDYDDDDKMTKTNKSTKIARKRRRKLLSCRNNAAASSAKSAKETTTTTTTKTMTTTIETSSTDVTCITSPSKDSSDKNRESTASLRIFDADDDDDDSDCDEHDGDIIRPIGDNNKLLRDSKLSNVVVIGDGNGSGGQSADSTISELAIGDNGRQFHRQSSCSFRHSDDVTDDHDNENCICDETTTTMTTITTKKKKKRKRKKEKEKKVVVATNNALRNNIPSQHNKSESVPADKSQTNDMRDEEQEGNYYHRDHDAISETSLDESSSRNSIESDGEDNDDDDDDDDDDDGDDDRCINDEEELEEDAFEDEDEEDDDEDEDEEDDNLLFGSASSDEGKEVFDKSKRQRGRRKRQFSLNSRDGNSDIVIAGEHIGQSSVASGNSFLGLIMNGFSSAVRSGTVARSCDMTLSSIQTVDPRRHSATNTNTNTTIDDHHQPSGLKFSDSSSTTSQNTVVAGTNGGSKCRGRLDYRTSIIKSCTSTRTLTSNDDNNNNNNNNSSSKQVDYDV